MPWPLAVAATGSSVDAPSLYPLLMATCDGVFSLAVRSGSVSKVKILGCLGMIDDGETDWKVICINADDPLASQLNDIDDVERVLPGYISVIREWLVRALVPAARLHVCEASGVYQRLQLHSRAHGSWVLLQRA